MSINEIALRLSQCECDTKKYVKTDNIEKSKNMSGEDYIFTQWDSTDEAMHLPLMLWTEEKTK